MSPSFWADIKTPNTHVELPQEFEQELTSLQSVLASPEPQEQEIRRRAASFAAQVTHVVDDLHSSWVNSYNNYVDMVDARLDIEVPSLKKTDACYLML